ncbi:hypothetical protein L596_008337 [Steinernema carpocapsae]|uniref:Uncharacterized protein n=1 Tax=Steinernema carpocapsae TaxID=34508 RepID=A0A4U5PC63_STECR|nr:hypothetical protein L596_008337 [Steinernema carpocapsae]
MSSKSLSEWPIEKLMSSCGRPAEIQLGNKSIRRGNVYAIHPMNFSVTLIEFDSAETKPKKMWVIPGCNVKSFRLLNREETSKHSEVVDPSPELALWMSQLFGHQLPKLEA